MVTADFMAWLLVKRQAAKDATGSGLSPYDNLSRAKLRVLDELVADFAAEFATELNFDPRKANHDKPSV